MSGILPHTSVNLTHINAILPHIAVNLPHIIRLNPVSIRVSNCLSNALSKIFMSLELMDLISWCKFATYQCKFATCNPFILSIYKGFKFLKQFLKKNRSHNMGMILPHINAVLPHIAVNLPHVIRLDPVSIRVSNCLKRFGWCNSATYQCNSATYQCNSATYQCKFVTCISFKPKDYKGFNLLKI